MKTFLEYINEDHPIDGFDGAGLSSSTIPYDIEDPIIQAKVNAILGHTAVSEFLNPHAAIADRHPGRLGRGDIPARSEAPLCLF